MLVSDVSPSCRRKTTSPFSRFFILSCTYDHVPAASIPRRHDSLNMSAGQQPFLLLHPEPESFDLQHFMMGDARHAPSTPSLATPPQTDGIGNAPFADFAFAFHVPSENGIPGDAEGDSIDPYNLAGQTSALEHGNSAVSTHHDHRGSIVSMPDHRGSISSVAALPSAGYSSGRQAGGSEGSEGASPASNRPSAMLDGGLSDEFALGSGAVDGSDLGCRAKEDRSDPHPPWSELKTKAGKERKRLPLACIACRRKKIRCSGEKPACRHCLRSRTPCVYKVTTRKAAPRTDYMAMLDKRLKRMEERIIKIVPKEEQDAATTSVVTRAVVKPAIPGTMPVKNASKKRAVDEAFGQELDSWSRTAATNSMLDGANKPAMLVMQEAEENRLLTEGAEALPSKELQEHLSEIFFENVNGQTYHLLHKPSFMRKLRYEVFITSLSRKSADFHFQSWDRASGLDTRSMCDLCTLFYTPKAQYVSCIP